MKKIENKYKENQLSDEELRTLKSHINNMSDSQLENYISEEWLLYNIDDDQVEDEKIDRIKHKINQKIFPQKKKIFPYKRIFQIAGSLLIPILLLSTVYFYNESRIAVNNLMIVSTGKGEKANVTLPDGTQVYLNADSRLEYLPLNYNKKERIINFEGEAFFDVYRNIAIPFKIKTNDIEVKVLGTKFNFLSRFQNSDIEVFLEEGHLLLSSLFSNNKQELFTNQKAILNKKTGLFTVFDSKIEDVLEWRQAEFVFQNATLKSVIHKIENKYNIKIHFVDCHKIENDLFTGTLPTNNLSEALYILQRSYHFDYSISENIVTFSCKR